MHTLLRRSWAAIVESLMALVWWPGVAIAQDGSQSGMSCPMCGMMTGASGWIASTLGVVLVVSIIAVLVALVVFLVMRSRGPSGRPTA